MEFDFYAIVLIFVRITAFFSISKVLFPSGTSNRIKVGLSFILTYLIYLNFNKYQYISGISFIFAVVNEAMAGAILSLILNIVFDILIIVGSWIDTHIGLSMASLYDPAAESQLTINSKLLYYVGLVIFVVSDGYKIIISSLFSTFKLVPLGESILSGESLYTGIAVIIEYFFIAIRIALPIILIILLSELCLAFISRAVPQINVMILGMPIKIFLGLISILLLLPIILKYFINVFNDIPDIFNRILALDYQHIFDTIFPGGTVLAFAAVPGGEKTEEATPKKKADTRKKGQVAKSKDVSQALTLLAVILVLIILSSTIINVFTSDIIYYFNEIGNEVNIDSAYTRYGITSIWEILKCTLLFIIPIMLAGIAGHLIQGGFMFTSEAIKPKFSKLNPINGFKNIFSKKSLIALVKNIIVVIIVGYIGYQYVSSNFSNISQISNIYFYDIGIVIKSLVTGILFRILIVTVILAAADYFIELRLFKKEIMMTKQEVKDEYKDIEGDPNVKAMIKRRQKEILQNAMLFKVKDATVVITNPTHFAVALQYEIGKMSAPVVVAKGQDNIAFKIRDIAKENKVAIVENKPLARALYAKVEIGDEIPEELYEAVIQVLGIVYKMNKKI